jgi:hypothetical protein
MTLSADAMIAALDALTADSYGGAVVDLLEITRGFDRLAPAEKERVVPAMFRAMERSPDADLGSPGPLVHAIESLPVERYEPELVESVRRRPMYLNLWMVNRILNGTSDRRHREKLLELLRGVLSCPWSAEVGEIAAGFLEFQDPQTAG